MAQFMSYMLLEYISHLLVSTDDLLNLGKLMGVTAPALCVSSLLYGC